MANSIESLFGTASDPGGITIIVRTDNDDGAEYWSVFIGSTARILLLSGPRFGYSRLHEYYNELSRRASGDWLFLWNDDAIMQTEGWDDIVRSYNGKAAILNPQTNHNNHEINRQIFPIVPKRYVDAIGHFSLNAHCDTWWEEIGNNLGLTKNVPINILHDRADMTGNNDDQTYRERVYQTGDFFSEEMKRARERDMEIIRGL